MERAIEPMRQRDKNLQRASQSAKSSKMNGFAACVTDAKLKDVHPHDLRRTFGSWLVQAGVGIERVSELLRHGDISIIAGVYAHLLPDDLASAAAILDRPAAAIAEPKPHTQQNRGL